MTHAPAPSSAPTRAPSLPRALARLLVEGAGARLLLGLLLAQLTVLAGIALLGLSGWFITAAGIAGGSVAAALAFDVFAPAAAIRFLAILRTGARYAERLATHDAALASLAALRERLFRGLAFGAPRTAARLRPARDLFRLTLDVDALDALYLRGAVPLAALTAAALALGLAVGCLDARAGIAAALALLTLGLAAPALAARAARAPARRRARLLETYRAGIAALVHGQTDLLMAGRLAPARARLAEAEARLAGTDATLDRVERRAGAALGLGAGLLLAAGLPLTALLAERGAATPALAAFALLALLAAAEPFAALRRAGPELARAHLAATRLAGANPVPDQPQAPAIPKAPREPAPALALRGVTLRHPGAAAPALSDITLALAPGERLAITGPSGGGKSTLIALLSGALAPESGTADLPPATLLIQRTGLFRDTLRDNLRLADPAASDARLQAALALAGLAGTIAALPEGLDTRLGEGGIGLSGGQARRLALARASLLDRPLWLLDEPTDGLDAATAADVLARIERATRGRALVIATHIRREAALADRILALSAGRLTAEAARGTPAFDRLLAGLRPD